MKSYIYAHVNPDTGEILYIGSGRNYRATILHPGRSSLHDRFMRNCKARYRQDEWCVFLACGLEKEEAHRLERELIHKVEPVFNRLGRNLSFAFHGPSHASVLTEEQVSQIKRAYLDGLSIRRCAAKWGVGYHAARNAIRGRGWAHVKEAA